MKTQKYSWESRVFDISIEVENNTRKLINVLTTEDLSYVTRIEIKELNEKNT